MMFILAIALYRANPNAEQAKVGSAVQPSLHKDSQGKKIQLFL
jgi:hypothetical protein